MEVSLQKLNQQAAKYTDELHAALAQFGELSRQAADMDVAELDAARQSIRSEKGNSAWQRIRSAYGDKFDPVMMLNSKQDVTKLLHEDSEKHRPLREQLRKSPQKREQRQPKSKRRDYER